MSNKKIISLPLIIAGLLFIINDIIEVPAAESSQFLPYAILKSLSKVGLLLVPLYLGTHANYFKNKNTFLKISNFALIYWITSIITALLGFLVFKASSLKNFWAFLFPISQNLYPYASSLVLVFLFLPFLIKGLDNLEQKKLTSLLYLATFLITIVPIIFGKNIWGNNISGLLLLNLYLIVLGYSLNRLKLINHQYKFLKLLASLIVFVSSILLMFYISPMIHDNYSTIGRFTTINSLFTVILAVFLFDCLDNKLQLPTSFVTTFLIVTIIVSYQPNSVLNLTYDKHINSVISVILNSILTICLILLQQTHWFQRLNYRLSFNSLSEFFDKLRSLKKWLTQNKRIIYVMLSFYLITLIQMYAIVLASHGNIIELFINFHPAIFLSMIITTIFFLLIYLLTNRFWYSYGFIFLIELLLTISSFLKVQLRAEPVLPTDMSALKSASDILDMISPLIVVVGIITILIFMAITIVLQLRYQQQFKLKLRLKQRLIYIILLLAGLSGLLFVNHQNTIPSRIFDLFHIQKKFFNQENGARINGPMLQFINNLDVSVMKKPAGYSKESIQDIMKKYNQEATKINSSRNDWSKNQTIIFALSESFSDPRRVPNLKMSGNPIPDITNIKNQTSSGLMMSSGYGGGTANMEWQSLTGLDLSSLSPTLPTPYSQLVTHLDKNPNITNLFDEKIAIHPYNASLYNRKEVFNDFGFQKFYYLGSPDKLKHTEKIAASPYISDESAYEEVEDLISKNSDKSQFIQLSTMQNHLPFDGDDTKTSIKVSGSAIGNNKSSITNYVERISSTDKAVQKFLDKLDKIDRPITLVWYGDHLPGIYSGDSMSQYAVPLHQTDYFVFNNKAAKNRIKFNKLVSPYSFSALALKQANIKVSPYYALITDVTTNLPASMNDPHTTVKNTYNGAQVFIDSNNKVFKSHELTKKQKSILNDYKLIQYDIVAGKQYSAKWAMQKAN